MSKSIKAGDRVRIAETEWYGGEIGVVEEVLGIGLFGLDRFIVRVSSERHAFFLDELEAADPGGDVTALSPPADAGKRGIQPKRKLPKNPTPPRPTPPANLLTTEAALQKAVKDAAKRLDYDVYHTHYSPGSDRGYPDLHVCGYGQQFFFEFKGPRGRVSPEQERWIARLQECPNVIAAVIRPEDYDLVIEQLQAVYMIAHGSFR